MSRIGHQTQRDLESCGNCGHARMDHERQVLAHYKHTFVRGRCTMDCGCRAFERWRSPDKQRRGR